MFISSEGSGSASDHANIKNLLPHNSKSLHHKKDITKLLQLLNFIIDTIIESQTHFLTQSHYKYNEIQTVNLLLQETRSFKTDFEKKFFFDYLQNEKNKLQQKIVFYQNQKKINPIMLSEFLKQNELIIVLNEIDQYIFVSYFLEKKYKKNKLLAKHYYALLPHLIRNVITRISTDISDREKSEASLQTAKKEAEAANRAKTEFLENMRHDIRTPLTGMIGFARLIQNEAINPRVKEYADNLMLATQALLDFQNDILNTIKITKESVPVLQEIIDLKNTIEKVFNLIRPKAIIKKLALELIIDNDVPTHVCGDAKRLFKIILELTTNALKFTAQGKIQIHLSVSKIINNQILLKCEIADTGVGIPDDQQTDIFDRFHRLSPSSDGVYEGTGLGLTVVKKYIKDLSGKISVESRVGIGTTFIFLIPFLIAHNAEEKKSQRNDEKILFHSLRILLVEDHEMTATVTQLMLRELQCEIDIAIDAKTTLEKINAQHYDLILMDLGLPDCTGFELAQKIRAANITTPIVALTAHREDEHALQCEKYGINAIFQKPLLKTIAINILNVHTNNR